MWYDFSCIKSNKRFPGYPIWPRHQWHLPNEFIFCISAAIATAFNLWQLLSFHIGNLCICTPLRSETPCFLWKPGWCFRTGKKKTCIVLWSCKGWKSARLIVRSSTIFSFCVSGRGLESRVSLWTAILVSHVGCRCLKGRRREPKVKDSSCGARVDHG